MTDGARKRSGVEPTLSRRAFLEGVAGGAFVIGFYVPAAGAAADAKGGVFAPNAFIRIDKSGRITLVMPQVEMGQGIYTAIAMILAEELDAAFEHLTLEAAPPSDKLYGNPTFGIQATGNSNSIRAFWLPLRKAAAGARAMLVEAAAEVWKVDPTSIRTEASTAIHAPSGRRLAYAALIERATPLAPPPNPPLKDPKDFKLIGKPLKRFDTPDKVNGKVVYGIDVMPPGVKFATLAACPVFGGTVAQVDDSRAKSLPGCSYSRIWSRSSAITCGRPSRVSRPSTSRGMRAATPASPRPTSGSKFVRRASRRAPSRRRLATPLKACPRASGTMLCTNCPFSCTRRWSP
jgi:isoquinoline 1-oxidoreductase beta subunit